MRLTAGAFLTLALILCPLATAPASAQASVTATDMQRLQEVLEDLTAEVSRVRTDEPQRAGSLQTDLEELRDELGYLRVRLRREKTVPRSEYHDLRDRLDDFRSRARGEAEAQTSPAPRDSSRAPARSSTTTPPAERASAIPVGQELDVRLQDPLSSDRNQVEDRFVATTVVDLEVDGRVIIPAGSEVRGVVSSVQPAGRIERTGRMTVTFDQITVNGRTHMMRGTVTEALQSSGVRGEAGRIGAGAGVGAIIGGIIGGVRGALAGILIGGGGVIAATEGKDVELPVGTILRLRLDAPPGIK